MKRIVLIALNMAIYCDLWNGIIANEAKSKEEEKLFVSGHKIIVGHKVIWKCLHLLGKERTICERRCREENTRRSLRILRSTNNDTSIKTMPRMRSKVSYECYPDANELKSTHGIKNAKAKIRKIVYSLYRNKSIARVIWDPPAECAERRDVCTGYFVRWLLARNAPDQIRCQTIYNMSLNYIILDASTGFDGIKSFDVDVRAIPYQTDQSGTFWFMDPPPPETLTKPIIFIPTTKPAKTTRIKSSTETLLLNTTSASTSVAGSTKSGKGGQTVQKQTATTLIFSLSVFAVVIIGTVGLVIRRMIKPHEQPLPTPREVIKGTIYISYLPQKSIINQVSGIYSWLKSQDIDVVIDQMYDDQKLYNSLGPKRFGEKFLAHADKVIMIVTHGYLKLCWLDDTVDLDSMPCFISLDEERLYSEVTHIKNELSTSLKHGPTRFIPVLVDVPEDYLPKWLENLTTVKWPEDGKNNTFLNLLKSDIKTIHPKFGEINSV